MSYKIRSTRSVLGVLAMLTLCNCASTPIAQGPQDQRDVASLRDFLKTTVTESRNDDWSANVSYDERVDSAALLADARQNEEASTPSFATLQRSFGNGEVRPFLGLGLGDARTHFSTAEEDEFALQGVVGTRLKLDERVDAFFQYGYAVLSGTDIAAKDEAAHGISFGFQIKLGNFSSD